MSRRDEQNPDCQSRRAAREDGGGGDGASNADLSHHYPEVHRGYRSGRAEVLVDSACPVVPSACYTLASYLLAASFAFEGTASSSAAALFVPSFHAVLASFSSAASAALFLGVPSCNEKAMVSQKRKVEIDEDHWREHTCVPAFLSIPRKHP